MLLAGLAYVVTCAQSLPFVDDWLVVPQITGVRSVTPSWLWEQNAQNRHAPSKAILVGLVKIAGGDFRIVPLLNLLALGGLAFAMIRAAALLRGRISFVDAFFPLLLLNWGLRPYLLLASDIVYHTWPTGLALILLVIIVRGGTTPTLAAGLLGGACLLLLSLTKGILYTPAMTLWLAVSGYRLRRAADAGATWRGTVLIVLGSIAALLIPLYFVGFDFGNAYGLAADPSLPEKIRVGLGFLASGFAMRERFWPYLGVGVLVLLLLGSVVLARAARGPRPDNRSRAQAMLLYLAAVATLVLAVGWGREALGVEHSVRYHVLGIPVLCAIYYAWGLSRGRLLRFSVQLALFVCVALAAGANTGPGLEFGRRHRAVMQAFERDIRGGMPPHELVARYKGSLLYWGTHEDMVDYLRMLGRAGIGPFGELREDPVFREIPLPAGADFSNGVRWEGRTAFGTGVESELGFRLKSPRLVAGIRLLCSHSHPENAHFELRVDRVAGSRRGGASSYVLVGLPEGHSICGPLGGEPRPVDFYVADRIGGFRIHPDDKPFAFRISEVRLLVSRR